MWQQQPLRWLPPAGLVMRLPLLVLLVLLGVAEGRAWPVTMAMRIMMTTKMLRQLGLGLAPPARACCPLEERPHTAAPVAAVTVTTAAVAAAALAAACL